MLAVCLLTAFAGLTAFASAFVAGYVLDQLQSGEALAMIVTDGGIRSDSRDLERNMSSATSALMSLRDFSLALSVGCVGIVLALGVRHWRSGKG